MGGQRSCFSNQPPLSTSVPAIPWPPGAAEDEGPSSWVAPRARSIVPWGSPQVWEGLFHQHPPTLSGTRDSDGDLILPKLGQSNRGWWDGSFQVLAEEWTLLQSLQPSDWLCRGIQWGCKCMPCLQEISASDALWEGKMLAP